MFPGSPATGTIEYALADMRLDEQGNIWEPEEDDPSAELEGTSPFHIVPYQGRYG